MVGWLVGGNKLEQQVKHVLLSAVPERNVASNILHLNNINLYLLHQSAITSSHQPPPTPSLCSSRSSFGRSVGPSRLHNNKSK